MEKFVYFYFLVKDRSSLILNFLQMDLPHSEAVLCDNKIKEEMTRGNIVIFPYCETNLANCSYDVRLGENYYRSNKSVGVLNPWSEKHIKAYWGSPLKASSAPSHTEAHFLGVEPGQPYILIDPGETILGHTIEFIGGLNNITTMMKTRSSLRRSGVSCCMCAGWGDIGYVNRWTMEITNHTEVPVILPVGTRVAQIIFLYTGKPSRSYSSKGKYQTSDDINQIIKTWTEDAMLPRLYKDFD